MLDSTGQIRNTRALVQYSPKLEPIVNCTTRLFQKQSCHTSGTQYSEIKRSTETGYLDRTAPGIHKIPRAQ
jgi:hypothetical protein